MSRKIKKSNTSVKQKPSKKLKQGKEFVLMPSFSDTTKILIIVGLWILTVLVLYIHFSS